MTLPISGATSGIGSEWTITPNTQGAEWTVDTVAEGAESPASGGGFGSILGKQIQSLQDTQNAAAAAAQSLATGDAADPSAAILAVDRARLSMQMASVIRTKGVEAFQDVFRTQV
ncbi:MAG TPA: flagellar hook-basal body complex protein FliE [Baekduia sp.]|nr:flagellar hook-basal body complex protein FliE [Baekduia sp.]